MGSDALYLTTAAWSSAAAGATTQAAARRTRAARMALESLAPPRIIRPHRPLPGCACASSLDAQMLFYVLSWINTLVLAAFSVLCICKPVPRIE